MVIIVDSVSFSWLYMSTTLGLLVFDFFMSHLLS